MLGIIFLVGFLIGYVITDEFLRLSRKRARRRRMAKYAKRLRWEEENSEWSFQVKYPAGWVGPGGCYFYEREKAEEMVEKINSRPGPKARLYRKGVGPIFEDGDTK